MLSYSAIEMFVSILEKRNDIFLIELMCRLDQVCEILSMISEMKHWV